MSNITKLNTFFCDTANTTWTTIAWESKVLNKLYQSIRDFSSFFFCRLLDEYLSCLIQARIKQERLWSKYNTRFIKGYKTDLALSFQKFQVRATFQTLKSGTRRHYFMIFVSLMSVKRCLKWKFFPSKKLTKTRRLRTHAPVFSLSIL